MKIREGFVLREVADSWVVVATGEASKHFVGMITLNQTGKDIWECVQEGCSEEEVVARIAEKYEADQEEVAQDVHEMIEQMSAAGFLV